MNDVTVCVTSCGRWNLLQATLNSFLKLNTYPITKYLLHEDSGDIEIFKKIQEKYPMFHCIRSEQNAGLLKSIDNLYTLVDTEYIMHIEDDWIFENNPNFIQQSIDILSTREDIHQVWIRQGIPEDWLEKDISKGYQMVKQSHFGDWCGFSFNPGLRRLSDYKKIFPNGYNFYNTHGTNSALNEHECNQIACAQGYRAAILNNRVCRHLGEGKSTYK